MNRDLKFRDFEVEKKEMRYFDMDSYDKNEHDCFGNIMQKHNALSSKVGKDIYEGDIIQYSLAEGLGQPASGLRKEVVTMFEFDYGYYINVSLLGNIHENPELLK